MLSIENCFEVDRDYVGYDINSDPSHPLYGLGPGMRDSVQACQELCQMEKNCEYFTYGISMKACWLKTSDSGRKRWPVTISGKKYCGMWRLLLHTITTCNGMVIAFIYKH